MFRGHSPGILAVINAQSGSFEPLDEAAGRYRLTLNGVEPDSVWFQDRPGRSGGHRDTEALVKAFFKRPAKAGPQNVAVDIFGANDKTDLVILEATTPRYDKTAGRLVLDATALKQSKGWLAAFASRADAKIASRFGRAAMFVDDSAGLGDICDSTMTNWLDATLYAYDSSEGPHTSWFLRASDVGSYSTDHWQAQSPTIAYSCDATQVYKTEDGIAAGTTFSLRNDDAEGGSCTVVGDTNDAGCYCTFDTSVTGGGGQQGGGTGSLHGYAYLKASATPPAGLSSSCRS